MVKQESGAEMGNAGEAAPAMDNLRANRRTFAWAGGGLLFTVLSGIVIWLGPFSIATQMAVLFHTLIGAALLLLLTACLLRHWLATRKQTKWTSNISAYAGFWLLAVCLAAGLVVTYQALFRIVVSPLWSSIHLWSGVLTTAVVGYHVFPRKQRLLEANGGSVGPSLGTSAWKRVFAVAVGLCILPIVAAVAYHPTSVANYRPPASFRPAPGSNPFAPSHTESETGHPISPRLTATSRSCGAAGCHTAIYEEWAASAHRWAEQDEFFQAVRVATTKVQGVKATEKCGGCHAPVSMLAGYKDPRLGKDTPGYQEGDSCVICHAVRRVDDRGIGSYRLGVPKPYLYETSESPAARLVAHFLIRAYPRQHNRDYDLSIPRQAESCAPCHKEFDVVDNYPELLQVETQYDDWKNNHWNTDPAASRHLRCQQCHMPYRDAPNLTRADPYDLKIGQGLKYRNHRFAAANEYMPAALSLPGAAEQIDQVQKWLRGEQSVREIENIWAQGAIVSIAIHAPASVRPGQTVGVQVALTNRKAGHSFPTGPLNIVRVWMEVEVRDQSGNEIFHSGRLDRQNHVEDGTYVLRPIGITQSGQSIMTADIWHPQGPQYRPAIAPDKTESFSYRLRLPNRVTGPLLVRARLRYRKANQFFMDAVYPESHRAAPIIDVVSGSAQIAVVCQDTGGACGR